MDKKTLEIIIGKVIKKLTKNDPDLLKNNLHERTIVHKFACYLQELFLNYSVDVEYNRQRSDSKLPKKSAYQDVIIHKRGSNYNNLLVIEIKKSNSDDKNPNINRYLVDSSLKYQYGLYLEFGVGNNFGANKLKWFPEIEELSK